MRPDMDDAPALPVITPDARRCAIYGRTAVGMKRDPDLAVLNVQRVMCSAYVRYHFGGSVVATYEDHGFPGLGLERPALQRLLSDVDAHKVDAVVVFQLDRLSRALPELARLMTRFAEAGVSLITVTEPRPARTTIGETVARRRGRR